MVRTKKNSWANAISRARKELNVKGFVAINRGTLGKQIYQRAKQLHVSQNGGGSTPLIGGNRSKKNMSWTQAISKARNQLGIKGFVAINRGPQGKQLYQTAKQLYN